MDLLLILTYTAICVGIFKIFKIPLNKWSVPTAVLGGIVLIGTLIMLMNYNHPYSELARNYYVSTPVVPLVKGRVTEVPVTPNQRNGSRSQDRTRRLTQGRVVRSVLRSSDRSASVRPARFEVETPTPT